MSDQSIAVARLQFRLANANAYEQKIALDDFWDEAWQDGWNQGYGDGAEEAEIQAWRDSE